MTRVTRVGLLILPVAAFATRGGDSGHGQGHTKGQKTKHATGQSATAGSQGDSAEQNSRDRVKPSKEAKAKRAKREKAAKKAKRSATAGALASTLTSDSPAPGVSGDETSTPEAADEGTGTPGPGVSNAFAHITANLERALAKIASGQKKQLPPGLVRVWLKFAGWLGVDPAQLPGTPVTPPAGSTEPTGSISPTATPEPTNTVEPSATIDTSATPLP